MDGTRTASRGPLRRAGLTVAVLVALTACGRDTPVVVAVYGSPDSATLEVATDTCNAHPSAAVEESGAAVRVRLSARRSWGSDDCADSVRVMLGAPLGTRVVVDDSTDRQVAVLPPD